MFGWAWVGGGEDVLGKTEVDGIERDDEVFGVVDFLEGSDDAGFSSDGPGEIFVGYGVLQTHALFRNRWQFVFVHGGQVVAVEPEVALNVRIFVDVVGNGKPTIPPANCTSYLRTGLLSHEV